MFTQGIAILEVFHGALGLVTSSLPATFFQVEDCSV